MDSFPVRFRDGCKTLIYTNMNTNVFQAVLGLVGLLAVVVVAVVIFGGYGAILAGVGLSCWLAGGCCDPEGLQE